MVRRGRWCEDGLHSSASHMLYLCITEVQRPVFTFSEIIDRSGTEMKTHQLKSLLVNVGWMRCLGTVLIFIFLLRDFD